MEVRYPILAIDYGERRIGLAVSDSKGLIATPLEHLTVGKSENWTPIFEDIQKVITTRQVKQLLIGMPQAFEPAHNIIREKIAAFTEQIQQITNLPVEHYDESFSTSQAQNMLVYLGINSKSGKGRIDSAAAAFFLQEFLDDLNLKADTASEQSQIE